MTFKVVNEILVEIYRDIHAVTLDYKLYLLTTYNSIAQPFYGAHSHYLEG